MELGVPWIPHVYYQLVPQGVKYMEEILLTCGNFMELEYVSGNFLILPI